MRTYTIGEAARAAGVTARAVRLYEAKALVPAPGRTDSGYRVFTDEHVEVLEFIRRGRGLGLSLDAIAEVMQIAASGAPCCERTRDLLSQRLDQIDAAIADLQRLRRSVLHAQTARVDESTSPRCALIEQAAEPE